MSLRVGILLKYNSEAANALGNVWLMYALAVSPRRLRMYVLTTGENSMVRSLERSANSIASSRNLRLLTAQNKMVLWRER